MSKPSLQLAQERLKKLRTQTRLYRAQIARLRRRTLPRAEAEQGSRARVEYLRAKFAEMPDPAGSNPEEIMNGIQDAVIAFLTELSAA